LTTTDDKARAALDGEYSVLTELAATLVRLERDNLVERPWGGEMLRRFKRIPADVPGAAMPWGEAFEISAFKDDLEAERFPSQVRCADGSVVALPGLLEAQGEILLGEAFLARYGACYPLLPKTLSIKELLSVQGHPAGHTEVYIIIDADPGATLRLGFNRDIDAGELTRTLLRGIEQQDELLRTIGSAVEAGALQLLVAPWFASRHADEAALAALLDQASVPGPARAISRSLLGDLKALYWRMLDSMNVIEVRPGQVIYNATPQRLLSETGAAASAEVHALGNPERKEILALEIRRPGPTFRAWDNVRFPQRAVDVRAAIEALNLRATRPEEFVCTTLPVPGREGVSVSVDCEYFRVEHLAPQAGRPVAVPSTHPHSLHCLSGAVDVFSKDGRKIGRMEQGESALVPVGIGAYRVEADGPADLVRVILPEA
jgi:mannose-6-phosphate isomerase class I